MTVKQSLLNNKCEFHIFTEASVKMTAFFDIVPCIVSLTQTDVSEALSASIIRTVLIEAVRTSETSANFNETTPRYISEGSHLLHHRSKSLSRDMNPGPPE
jgi:hypothetical protein